MRYTILFIFIVGVAAMSFQSWNFGRSGCEPKIIKEVNTCPICPKHIATSTPEPEIPEKTPKIATTTVFIPVLDQVCENDLYATREALNACRDSQGSERNTLQENLSNCIENKDYIESELERFKEYYQECLNK